MLDCELEDKLVKQHYKIVGRHSAVKLCHWLRKSIMGEGVCYKEKFYGISSHRCLQFTPCVEYCSHQCIYCWRNTEHTVSSPMTDYDEPDFLVDEAIRMQKELLTGYGGIRERVDERKYLEAHHPNQAAISLAGEPTYYPMLQELLKEFHQRDFTTFLVSNGTNPHALEGLSEHPTQTYLSLDAPEKGEYERLCNPLVEDGWERLKKSLSILGEMDSRTVARLTMIKGMNMEKPQGYADLISIAWPDYVEVKGFMFVGGSRLRMSMDNMPGQEEIRDFSLELADLLGYRLKDEMRESRVVLLSKK